MDSSPNSIHSLACQNLYDFLVNQSFTFTVRKVAMKVSGETEAVIFFFFSVEESHAGLGQHVGG